VSELTPTQEASVDQTVQHLQEQISQLIRASGLMCEAMEEWKATRDRAWPWSAYQYLQCKTSFRMQGIKLFRRYTTSVFSESLRATFLVYLRGCVDFDHPPKVTSSKSHPPIKAYAVTPPPISSMLLQSSPIPPAPLELWASDCQPAE
jgi:hypothetical protein